MNPLKNNALNGLSIPKNRNFWISMALFAFVILTGVILLMDWSTSTRVEIFRRSIQMILFTFWGFDRFHKYRTQMAEAERSEDREAAT